MGIEEVVGHGHLPVLDTAVLNRKRKAYQAAKAGLRVIQVYTAEESERIQEERFETVSALRRAQGLAAEESLRDSYRKPPYHPNTS